MTVKTAPFKTDLRKQSQDAAEQSSKRHILTINCEHYFQAPSFARTIDRKRWSHFESRLDRTSSVLLEQLAEVGSTATFFVNPWIAQTRPDLVRHWLRSGHEIALSGDPGRSFRVQDPASLRHQVRRDRALLQDAIGHGVLGFRASDPLLGRKHLWAMQVLADEGFQYDSSLSPLLRAFAGDPWRTGIHRGGDHEKPFWIVPLTSLEIGGCMFPLAGGNYFRQYPEAVVNPALQLASRRDRTLVLYFRLWDFDPDQPRMESGSLFGNLRHYRNGHRMLSTMGQILRKYPFQSIAEHLTIQQLPLPSRPAPALPEPVLLPIQSSKATRTQVSLIVPCFNEETSIPYLSETLRSVSEAFESKYDLQIILVDDGSSDQTWTVLTRYFGNRPGYRLIQHPRNQGVSAAIHTGLAEAHEIACSMDCDCTYDPLQLSAMIDLLTDGVDLVTGSPYHPKGSVHNVPAWRLALSRGASLLYRCVTGAGLYTFTSCLRVYRRSVAVSLRCDFPGFLGIAELAAKLALDGHQIVEYPAVLESRIFGRSKMKVIGTIGGHLRLLCRLAGQRLQASCGRSRSRQRDTSPLNKALF